MKSTVIQSKPNAYSAREVAEAWGISERQVLQLAIDREIKLAVYGYMDTILQFDEEGNVLNEDSFFPFAMSGYRFLHPDDVAKIEQNGQAEIIVFEDPELGSTAYKKKLLVTVGHLRITKYERERFEAECGIDATRQPSIKETVSDTERGKLLAIVLGMAMDKYDYRPGDKKNAATGENNGSIAHALQKLGLKVDVDTIRKYLAEASERYKSDILQSR